MNTMMSVPTSLMRNLMMGIGSLPGISSQVAFGWGPTEWLCGIYPCRPGCFNVLLSRLIFGLGSDNPMPYGCTEAVA